MTGYTARKLFPYPTSEREYGRGGAFNEALARRADTVVTDQGVAWAAEMKKRTTIMVKASSEGPISQNNWYPIFMDTIEKETGGSVGGPQAFYGHTDREGYYHFFYSIELTNSGAGTANSRRRLRVDVSNEGISSEIVIRSFYTDGYWTNGAVNLEIDFVSYLGRNDFVIPYFIHTNAASGVNISNTNTRASCTLLLPTG